MDDWPGAFFVVGMEIKHGANLQLMLTYAAGIVYCTCLASSLPIQAWQPLVFADGSYYQMKS